MSGNEYMKRLYLWGAGHYGVQALKATECYDGVEVAAFIDGKKTGEILGIPIISPWDIVEWENIVVVISFADVGAAESVCKDLLSLGCKEIYYYLRKTKVYVRDGGFLQNECIDIGKMGDDCLLYCEMHVADCCNLNCRGCSHFSALYEKTFPEMEKRIDDIKKMKALFKSGIKIFNLLGGEPLMNPQINEYIERSRLVLPDSQIWLTTNGLMLPKMPESFFIKMSENNIMCSISEYKPTKALIEVIEKKLSEYKIEYNIRSLDIKQTFSLPLKCSKDSAYPHRCISNGCVNICDGKIARCPQLMFVWKLNKTFDLNYPEDGICDLNACADVKELASHLKSRVPLCDYCVSESIPWGTCHRPFVESDFIC